MLTRYASCGTGEGGRGLRHLCRATLVWRFAVVILAAAFLFCWVNSVYAVTITRVDTYTVSFSREASDFPFIWSVVGNNSLDTRPMGCYVDWYVYTDWEAEGGDVTFTYDLTPPGWNPYTFFEQLYFTATDMAGNPIAETLVVDPNPCFNPDLFGSEPATSPVLTRLPVSLDASSAALVASEIASAGVDPWRTAGLPDGWQIVLVTGFMAVMGWGVARAFYR